jgi:hypothetical protein
MMAYFASDQRNQEKLSKPATTDGWEARNAEGFSMSRHEITCEETPVRLPSGDGCASVIDDGEDHAVRPVRCRKVEMVRRTARALPSSHPWKERKHESHV